ncbi:MAG: QueT transporter family protein [Aerococcus sp.]|nr:QueT transporter family protein [Aerococcus sp.]
MSEQKSNTHVLVINAIVAAIYALLFFILPQVAWGPIQFRISEGLNHLNAFDRRYKWGVVVGVFVANFYGFATGLGALDLFFGTAHTLISFLICDYAYRFAKDMKQRLIVDVIVFSLMIFIVGIELYMIGMPFWATYGTLILSEAIILAITAPIMFYVNRAVDFKAKMTRR